MFDLSHKRALVTGGTQGIGYATAKLLAKAGATVFVNGATDPQKCVRAASEIGGLPAHADLLAADGWKRLTELTGDVDILVLNASIQYRRRWEEITEEEMDRQLDLNLKTSLKLMQAYFPHMKEQHWGRIITVGSVQQYKPHPDMAMYAAGKAAQMSLVSNIAKQAAPFGVTVNNVAPGVIATPRNAEALADPEYSKKVLAGIPMGYAGTGEDCAAGILFLASEEARYITGTDLVIDGGMKLA